MKEIIGWALAVVSHLKPKVTWKTPEMGQFELTLDGGVSTSKKSNDREHTIMSVHAETLTAALDKILAKAKLSLWLMIDRLDELFERRSKTEQRALRGLLHTLRLFSVGRIRVKVFLRDDILEQIVGTQGFTALSHVAARRSDTLRWSEEQILAMVVRRVFASRILRDKFSTDKRLLTTSVEYQRNLFYKFLRTQFTDHLTRARPCAGYTITLRMAEVW